ncbi:MAG TPA: hypothetical protein VF628_00485 [Allosphingosinicella sp.]|jgi:hypothetical protein
MKNLALLGVVGLFAACATEAPPSAPAEPVKVETSGKTDVPLGQVPAEVMAAANTAQAGFRATQAQSETRDGRRYFDVGGTQPDGSEIEFDIMEYKGRWTVVETQRDIPFAAAPLAVRQASAAHDATLVPTRVIESKQADGLVLYELYASANGDPQGRKVEIKWDGAKAQVLGREWAH